MARLLPTGTDATVTRSGDPSILCIDDDGTNEIFAALSSETARDIFSLLNEEPATPPTIAKQLDMSLQNVHYHLENLKDAALVDVADTCYSEKGREMEVFVVAEEPTLIFLGKSSDQPSLKRAFKALASVIGPSAVLLALGETLSRVLGLE